MAFPTTGILDDFNRADENPLANGNWSNPIRSGNAGMRLVSLRAAGHTASADSTSYWSAATYGPDSEAWVKIPTLMEDNGGGNVTVFVRITTPGASLNCYMAIARRGTGNWQLYRCVSGSFVSLGTAARSMVAGDGIGLEAIGTAIKVYRFTAGAWNQTPILSVSDGNVTGSGNVGLGSFSGSSPSVARMTPFGGGTVVAGIVPILMRQYRARNH